MGEANRRGTFEERKARAIEKHKTAVAEEVERLGAMTVEERGKVKSLVGWDKVIRDALAIVEQEHLHRPSRPANEKDITE